MKNTEAIQALYDVLDNQQTVSIKRLKELMSDANITVESSESKEVKYLKGEIRNLHKALKRKDKKIRRLENGC